MKLSKKRAAEIQLALQEAAVAQGAFWDALHQVEELADRDIDAGLDLAGWDVHDLFSMVKLKLSTGEEFKGEVTVPEFGAEFDKLIGKRPTEEGRNRSGEEPWSEDKGAL